MAGHLFIVHGDLTTIACDALMVPTDENFNLTEAWDALELDRPAGGWNEQLAIPYGERPREPQIWLGKIGLPGNDNEFAKYTPAIKSFVENASRMPLERRDRIYAWPKIRLAINVVGAGKGGGKERQGDLVIGLVKLLQALADKNNVDIVLVAYGDKLYAAAQRARRQLLRKRIGNRSIRTEDLLIHWRFDKSAPPNLAAKAEQLAKTAIDNRLVLFIGAGVSAGAGIPTWRDLLRSIAVEGRVPAKYLKLLESRDPRDAATLIDRKRHPPNTLRQSAAKLIAKHEHCSLQHALLASLPSAEAVSTNFDQLFEVASRVADRDLAVLPTHPEKSTTRWLLKLHGSVDDPAHMVLTRSDYLDMPRYHGALMGLVQGLLLTRHMMYVGYSLSDEDFHELVHEVRAARGSSGAGQATMLTLDADQAERDLWDDDLDIIMMRKATIKTPRQRAQAARQLEIFLDLLGFLATTSAAFFLDPAYNTLSADEAALREELKCLADTTGGTGGRDKDRVEYQVGQFLRTLGATDTTGRQNFTSRIIARDLDANQMRFPRATREAIGLVNGMKPVKLEVRGTAFEAKWIRGLPRHRCATLELVAPEKGNDRIPLRSLVGLGERLVVSLRGSRIVLQ